MSTPDRVPARELVTLASTNIAKIRKALQAEEPTNISEVEKAQRMTELGRALVQAIEAWNEANKAVYREQVHVNPMRRA